ncbi:MAG: ABC transporter ATP-binding protein [Rhodospirillaceae bacterium]|nr:ABC transporter ATP-binding protein [Rhodospirillaceae bacterium]
MAAVELEGVSKSFGRTPVLREVSLSVAHGEFVCLLGPSGCGKTTLLRIIAGLETADRGRVRIGGRDVTRLAPEDRDISMMFQSYALLPHLSVRENVRFPLRMRRRGTRAEQMQRVAWALALVRLEGLAGRMPQALSGGQQQRVALARAIVPRPTVLLLDEPLSNLDARLREDMQMELIDIHRRLGITTVLVTHDQEEALSMADRIVLLHDGRIERVGTPDEVYSRPGSAFASTFVGAANLIPVTVENGPRGPLARFVAAPGIALPLPAGAGGNVGRRLLMVRQEDVLLRTPSTAPPGAPAWPGTVDTRAFLGARCRLLVTLEGLRLKCLQPGNAPFRPGEPVMVAFRPERLQLVEEPNAAPAVGPDATPGPS